MPNKRLNLKNILIAAGFVCVIAFSSYQSYRIGVTTAHEKDMLIEGNIYQRNTECIKNKDIKCIAINNWMSIVYYNSKLHSLKEKGLFVSDRRALDKYITWSDSIVSENKK